MMKKFLASTTFLVVGGGGGGGMRSCEGLSWKLKKASNGAFSVDHPDQWYMQQQTTTGARLEFRNADTSIAGSLEPFEADEQQLRVGGYG